MTALNHSFFTESVTAPWDKSLEKGKKGRLCNGKGLGLYRFLLDKLIKEGQGDGEGRVLKIEVWYA